MRYPGRSLLLSFTLVALAASPARADSVSGDVRVIDGDSIVVGGTHIRIWGIDAPEMGTREGDAAKKYLKMLVKDAPVRCEDDGTRIQGRIMAKCFIGAIDIGGIMVMSGNARDWRRYSRGHYTEVLKLAGITPRRRLVARRAPPKPKPVVAKPAVIESLASRPERDAARTAPAPTPALNRPTAARYPTAPAIVAEPPQPFRPVKQAAPAQPPVSAAPRATVSAPTPLAPPPQAAAVPVAAEDETPPATVQKVEEDE